MKKRKSVNRNKSRKLFAKTTASTKKININPRPSRGGIRM